MQAPESNLKLGWQLLQTLAELQERHEEEGQLRQLLGIVIEDSRIPAPLHPHPGEG